MKCTVSKVLSMKSGNPPSSIKAKMGLPVVVLRTQKPDVETSLKFSVVDNVTKITRSALATPVV